MTQLTIQQAVDLALRHHRAGQLQEAERICRQVFARQPQNADALHILGMLAGQAGQHQAAIDLIGRAIQIKPHDGAFYSNLGESYRRSGRLDEAIAAGRQAIALNPNSALAHYNLGVALRAKEQYDQAIIAHRQAIALNPNFPEAHNNLGIALEAKGQLDQAIAAYRQALKLNPNLADAYVNLGSALQAKGQLDEAIAACRQALILNPNLPGAYNNLGTALRTTGQLNESIAAFRQALVLTPNSPEAPNNLGTAFQATGQLDEAVAAYHQALTLDPRSALTLGNLGEVFKNRGQLDKALDYDRKATALQPQDAALHSNLCFAMHFHPDFDAASILAEMRCWAERHERPLAGEIRPHANDPSPDRRLKIGYVSPDFREHPIGRCYVPLFAHHNHQQFEIICYSDVVRKDAITQRLQGYSDQWHDVAGLSHAQLAEKIRGDGIDLLVDGTGHTGLNRLLVFARKPAPVQITWLGYPGSTGMSGMDYRLTDPYLDPPGQGDEFYSEQSIRLPHCCWCFEPIDVMPPVNALPAPGAGHVTFGCFNNFAKINAGALQLWIGILSALPASRLILQCPLGSHRDGVRQMFQNAGIDPHRLELVAKTPSKLEYFEQYHKVDLCLDPMPYNGHTTNFDALWMGVPVVTLCGKTAVGRAGASVLSNLDLREFIGLTSDEYVSIAVKMGSDLSNLSQLRETMRQRMQTSPVMDGKRYAADVEAAYRGMWRNWCEKPPRFPLIINEKAVP